MWICSKCGAKVEPSFDVCWRCGTSYQGEEDPDFVTADESPAICDPTDYLRLDAGKPTDPELAEPPLDLAPCFESNDLAEARFVADQLIGEGIPATLQNAFNVGIPSGTYSLYPCTVVVRADDLPRSRSWVEEYRGRRESQVRRSE
jgi:hypothetical protein